MNSHSLRRRVQAVFARWFVGLAVGMLGLLTDGHGSFLQAQEREARWQAIASLAAFATAYDQDPAWVSWRESGKLTELIQALDAGKLAEPAVIKALAKGLPAANSDEGRAARTALVKWGAALESPARPRLEDLRLPANSSTTKLPESLESLNEKLAAFTDEIQLGSDTEGPWRDRLRLASLEKLLAGKVLSPAEVEAVEAGWLLARPDWNNLAYRHALSAVQRLLVAARRKSLADGTERVQGAVRTLEDPAKGAEHAAAVRLLDDLDIASSWSIAWWSTRRQPQLQVRVRPPAMKPRNIDETYEINDVYAGTAVSGDGRFTGRLTMEWVNREVVPTLELRLQGNAVSSTVGENSGVTVQSSSRASVRGSKSIEWTERGLVGRPATASAAATVSFDAIDPGGGRARRRNAAVDQVYATRPAAEQDTQLAVERSCREKLDQQAEQWLRQANDWLDRYYRQPLWKQTQFAPRVRTARADGELSWDCWYGGPEEAGVATAPPIAPAAAWTIAVHEDFLTRYFLTQCAGELTTETLSNLLGTRPAKNSEGESPASNPVAATGPADSPRRVKLASDGACAVRVKDGHLTMTLRVSELATDQGNSSTPFEVQATYRALVENGALVMARRDPPSVRVLSGGATARAQTFKRLISRQSQAWFSERAELSPRDWSLVDDPSTRTLVTGLAMSEGWLVVTGTFSTP